MPKYGKLIAIEGLEGAGKSTAVNTVFDFLKRYQIEVVTTREPGGTAVGEALRAILKNPNYKDVMDARSELLMLYAARVQLVEEVIKPALQKGCWVVADRFELSSLAYQGGGRGLDEGMIRNLSSFCLQGLEPDLTLFMDIHPELGMQRVFKRGQTDRFEKEDMNFFMKVYVAYHAYLKNRVEAVVIDASLSLEEVVTNIKIVINQFIASHGYT